MTDRNPPASLAALLSKKGNAGNGSMFAMRIPEDGGQPVPVTRAKTCDCGAEFTQYQMAMSELESLERMGHLKTFLRKIPDAFVPVHCPPCERNDLDRQARIDAGYNTTTVPDRRQDIA